MTGFSYLSATAIIFLCVTLPALRMGAANTDVSEPVEATSEHPDTVPTINLDEVTVTAKSFNDVIPAQTLSGEALDALRNQSLADALRYFSGVQIKDYGGVGGIKTINIRSMGTNHTGVSYDGVQLGNAQNGQTDLGQFSMDNLEAISVYNGQKSQILQPARDFGNAGSVYLRTKSPTFRDGRRYHLRGGLRFGSFDLINPYALIELKLSERVRTSLSAEWLNSSGKYKFRYRRVNPAGEVAYDTTAVRQNGDINAIRLEANVFGDLPGGEWQAKVYTYNSERGVPGAIVNNVWRRGERIWDTNSFIQGRYQQSAGRFTTLANVKYAFYRTHYVNNDDKQIKIDNLYKQREIYLSTSNMYEIFPQWNVSLSYDFMWNDLHADVYQFAKPTRLSNLLSAATSVSAGPFQGQASLLWTHVHDRIEGQQAPADQSVWTPAVFASVRPIPGWKQFQVRLFWKKSFRMPTFNDLYYADMGNSKLNPERVSQYNAGLLWEYRPATQRGPVSSARVSADGYINRVHDKIVAYPKGQQFRWTMLNLGKVDIKGVDVSAEVTFRPVDVLFLTLRGQYTFQRAIDITNPADNYYRHQIPYIPRHSGSAIFNASWRGWSLNYSYIYVGERYNQQENIVYNYTQPWYTSDISLGKTLHLRGVTLTATLDVNNLFSQDYDVILNYPMPKRNYRVNLVVEI